MPTLVNNLRAIRGPVTAVPMVGQSGVIVEPDTVNNQVVVRADETVLWEGSKATAGDINLSEAFTNFEILRFFFKDNERHFPHVNDVGTDVSTASANWIGISTTVCGNDAFFTLMNMSFTYNNDKNVLTMPSLGSCAVFAMSNSTWTKLNSSVFSPPFEITKIVGINRIANN